MASNILKFLDGGDMIITISLPPATAERMKAAVKETNRTAQDLATWSIKEALLDHYKDRDDPAEKFMRRGQGR